MKQLKTLYTAFLLVFALCLSGGLLQAQDVMSLDEAMQIAEQNSPDIQRVRLNLVRSQENLNARQAALKSNFSLSISPLEYSNQRSFNELVSQWNTNETLESYGALTISQPIMLTDANISLTNRLGWQDSYSEYANKQTKGFSNNLFLSFNQPLFTYNRTKLQLRELEMNVENSQLNYAIQRLSLERYVVMNYYNVYQKQTDLAIAKEAFQNMQESYEIIRNKVEAGLSAEEELFQAEVNLASSRSDFENKQVNLENTKDDFKILIGMSLFEDFQVLPDIQENIMEVDIDLAIEQALENRMELRQREIDIENARFDLIQTNAMNEFKGNLGMSFGLFGDNEEFTSIYETPTDNQQVAFSLTIPLWDWGEKKSRMKAAEASLKSTELSLDEERNQIILNVRKTIRNLKNLRNQIDLARQNADNSKLTYELNLERYRNGDLTSMDLNIFQNQLSEKQTALTNAIISYKLELLNLKIQTLYDFEAGKSVSVSFGETTTENE